MAYAGRAGGAVVEGDLSMEFKLQLALMRIECHRQAKA